MVRQLRPLAPLLLVAAWVAPGVAQEQPADEGRPLGQRAAFGVLEAGPTVFARTGATLRDRPDPRSEALTTVAEDVSLPVLDRRGDWVKTHYGEWIGWFAPDGEPTVEVFELTLVPSDAPVFDLGSEDRRLRIEGARALLDPERTETRTLGPWDLLSDTSDRELIDRLDRIATRLPSAYERRFGLTAAVDQRAVVVLFASETAYREFAADFTELGGFGAGGHADSSMAALFVGGEDAGGVESVLVHELTHLLNRSSFPEKIHSWLEEGLANDLGISAVDEAGEIELGSLGGEKIFTARRTAGNQVSISAFQSGGQRVWSRLLCDWRTHRAKLPSLTQLLELEWADFVHDDFRSSNYALSTFLVRYLLDDAPAEQAAAFRTFLTGVASGGASDGKTLASGLGATSNELESRYEHWLTAMSVQTPLGSACTDGQRLRLR